MMRGHLAQRAEQLIADREPFVHATVVRAVQPTSVRAGDTALVLPDGDIDGFVGGMCALSSVQRHAIHALETGEALLLRLEPGDIGSEEPERGVVIEHNPCLSGGSLEIFLDPQLPAARIVIAGDMPIARALEGIAGAAGYDAVRVEAADVVPSATDAALIVASHGHDEEQALARGLAAGVGYVGLVASHRRGEAVLASLDVDDATRARIHTPAGLDIGARAPAEIAIAILAEFVEHRRTTRPTEPALPIVKPRFATDPICGMQVLEADASIHLDTPDGRVWFCCDGCRTRYELEHVA
jgi:xanthine dehydrogenase accessory factor